jgi:5'-nucleotidase
MEASMHILLNNDDGISALGLNVLAETLAPHHQLTIIAPDTQRSGYGQSISVYRPLSASRRTLAGYPAYSIDGTPADCARLGINSIAPDVDLVISGINHGANVGTDIFYSGTAAAAREASFLNKQAIAVSLVDGNSFTDRAFIEKILLRAIDSIQKRPMPKGHILNINIPDRKEADILGVRVVPMGWIIYSNRYEEVEHYKSRPWYLPHLNHPKGLENGQDDINLSHQGYVTVTPIHWDLTSYDTLSDYAWMEEAD